MQVVLASVGLVALVCGLALVATAKGVGSEEISALEKGPSFPAKGHSRALGTEHLSPDTLAVLKDQKTVDTLATKLKAAQEKLGSMTMRQLVAMKRQSLRAKTSKLSQTSATKTKVRG